MVLLTIGHSRHPIDHLLALLRQHGVEVLVDVRSQPASRFSPQFNRKALERAVSDAAIRYVFLGDALGGRPRDPALYHPDGSLDPARVEATPTYQRGLAELRALASTARACVMCSEEDPTRCHRRLLITRTLTRDGVAVTHLRGTGALVSEQALRAAEQPPQGELFAPRKR